MINVKGAESCSEEDTEKANMLVQLRWHHIDAEDVLEEGDETLNEEPKKHNSQKSDNKMIKQARELHNESLLGQHVSSREKKMRHCRVELSLREVESLEDSLVATLTRTMKKTDVRLT